MKTIFKISMLISLLSVQGQAISANLYQEKGYHSLTADRRAQRIGDVITVLVVENSSAAATAGTKTDKTNAASIGITSLDKQRNFGISPTENFDGSGSIARTGRLLAQLSVTVVAIDPNGDLVVKGNQNLEINGEKQAITLEGKVRPSDISDSNTIPSTRIANAKITYIGDGILAESQHKGWLWRILSFLGLQ